MHPVGTVPTVKMHHVGTVPTDKMHPIGIVPTDKVQPILTHVMLVMDPLGSAFVSIESLIFFCL